MKRALLALVTSLLLCSVSGAQELTEDGYGSLHWGASLADAEKALPGAEKTEPRYSTQYGNGWLHQGGIPCDLILSPVPKQEGAEPSARISLYFYNGKFVAAASQYISKPVPFEAINGLVYRNPNELRDQILKLLGDTPNVDVKVSVGFQGAHGESAPPQDGMASLTVHVQLLPRDLVKSADEDIQKRLQKYGTDFLHDVPNAVLKP